MAFGDVVGRARVIVESDVDQTSLNATGGKIGAGLKRGLAVGVTALGGLAVAGVKAFQAFEEAEAVSAKLANTLGNMGKTGATESVSKLADELSRVTGIDDEVIKGGQTILATFKSVAASAGETGGTFERATQASLDLAATFNTDVSSASVMLGKALENPTKGVNALSRAGVDFDAEQRKLIQTLVESGDVLGAQEVILKAVEEQVKGNAEAGATASDKIRTAFDELNESIGGFLTEVSGGDITSIADAILALSESIDDLDGEKLGKFLETLTDSRWSTDFQENMNDDRESFQGFIDHIQQGFETIGDADLGEGWKALWEDTMGRVVEDFLDDLERVPERIENLSGQFRSAGRTIINSLIDGIGGSIKDSFSSRLSSSIKAAINNSLGLPRKITLGDGKGGVIPDFTVTIPALASGVRDFGGGLALVGEQGPELVSLPRGADVYSNSETRGMGDVTIVQNFNGPTSGAEARSEIDWSLKYGTRFPAIVSAV